MEILPGGRWAERRLTAVGTYDILGAAIRVAVAGVLVTSAAAKLRSPAAFRAVLHQLGMVPTRLWWLAACAAELFTAVAATIPADPVVPGASVAVLGLVFAAAGLRGTLLGGSVRCACFGTGYAGRLGWPQMAALPLWLLAAWSMTWWQPAGPDQPTALAATVLVAALAVHLAQLVQTMRAARFDRLALAEKEMSHT